jgi:hypothetical protein
MRAQYVGARQAKQGKRHWSLLAGRKGAMHIFVRKSCEEIAALYVSHEDTASDVIKYLQVSGAAPCALHCMPCLCQSCHQMVRSSVIHVQDSLGIKYGVRATITAGLNYRNITGATVTRMPIDLFPSTSSNTMINLPYYSSVLGPVKQYHTILLPIPILLL